MEVKITKKDVIWGYTAQFFNIGANAFLLPFILKLLPTEMLGIWYVFLSIAAFALMLDFGFQPTFSRNVAYIFSGATKLKKEGVDEECERLDGPNFSLLKNIIGTMRRFYGCVSAVSILLMLIVGTWYIDLKIDEATEISADRFTILLSWVMYCISVVLSFFYSYYNALLIGRGQMKEYNQMTIVTKMVYLLLAMIGLVCGYGIFAIAMANFLSIIVNRIFAVQFFNNEGVKEQLQQARKSDDKLFPIIWFNARKVGIGGIGSFFVQRGNTLFVSMFLPLDIVANFGLTTQIINILAGIAPLYQTTHLPEIYKYRINQNLKEIRRIFGESVFVFALIYVSASIFILLCGNLFLHWLGSETSLLPFFPLLLYLITQCLESNHGMAAQLITTRNEVPYVNAAILSGGCIALLTVLALAFTNLGILGAILPATIVQLSYNNWRWPSIVSKELKASYPRLFVEGFVSLRKFFFRHFK